MQLVRSKDSSGCELKIDGNFSMLVKISYISIRELTNHWKIHFQSNMLKKFESIHVRHVNIADYDVIAILPLPKKVQSLTC